MTSKKEKLCRLSFKLLAMFTEERRNIIADYTDDDEAFYEAKKIFDRYEKELNRRGCKTRSNYIRPKKSKFQNHQGLTDDDYRELAELWERKPHRL